MQLSLNLFSRRALCSALIGISPLALHAGDKAVTEPAPTAPWNALCFFDNHFCFDVQERTRFESRDNLYDFNSAVKSPTDGNWVLNRFRVGADWKPTSWLEFYAQGQDSREWGSDRPKIPGAMGAEGDDLFDLRQANVKIGDPSQFPLQVQLGRQTLQFGELRLIGDLDWNNFSRTWDAAKVSWIEPKWRLDAFAASEVVINRYKYNQSDLFNGNDNHRNLIFSGLYFTAGDMSFGSLDLYALWLSQSNGTGSFQQAGVAPSRPLVGPASKPTSFGTYGGRLWGDPKKLNGFEFDVEGAYQNGEVEDLHLDAFAVHAGAGYNVNIPWKPRLWTEYNFATGDSDPTDRNSQTFQNLFPTNHKFYGYMDLFSWQNMHDPAVSLQLQPTKWLSTELVYRAYWLASNNDVSYRSNGLTPLRPLTPAARNGKSFVGTELDFIVTAKVCKNFTISGGFCHFFPGDYIRETGPSDPANFGYVMTTFTF